MGSDERVFQEVTLELNLGGDWNDRKGGATRSSGVGREAAVEDESSRSRGSRRLQGGGQVPVVRLLVSRTEGLRAARSSAITVQSCWMGTQRL